MDFYRHQAFTLIELLIVLVIISILAAIALPNYYSSVLKTHRKEGIAALNSVALEQEKYRSNNSGYGNLANVWSGTSTENGYYSLAVSNPSSTGYTVTATAQSGQASDSQNGTSCSTLTLSVSGLTTSRTPASCWK